MAAASEACAASWAREIIHFRLFASSKYFFAAKLGCMVSELPAEKASPGRMFVGSLAFANLADGLSSAILGLLTVEIALTFLGSSDKASVAAVSQISTVVNAFEAIFALFMSFLVVRFRSRSLLLTGILLIAVSAAGSALATNLVSLGLFAVADGFGSIMLSIMAFTLIGELLVFEKKAQAISYLVAASYLAGIFGVIGVGLIATVGGWRSVFSLFVLPLAVVSLILCFVAVPSRVKEKTGVNSWRLFVKASKQVLLNKSAASCLIAGLLLNAAAFVSFVFAFYTVEFGTSVVFRSLIMSAAAAVFIVASLVAGKISGRGGAKTLAVVGALGNGVLNALFFFMPNVWAALVVHMVGLMFGATGGIAFSLYALEQVPMARGTMMSLRRVFQNLGQALGPAVGGVALFFFSYQVLGLMFGGLSIAGAITIYFLTKEPAQT